MGNSCEQVCWCSVRTWCLVIGWLQTILGGLEIFETPVYSTGIGNVVEKQKYLQSAANVVLIKTILWVLRLINFIGGISLILGVLQKSVKTLKVWKVLNIVMLIIVYLSAFQVMLESAYEQLKLVLSLVGPFFGLWVVSFHQDELENTRFNPGC